MKFCGLWPENANPAGGWTLRWTCCCRAWGCGAGAGPANRGWYGWTGKSGPQRTGFAAGRRLTLSGGENSAACSEACGKARVLTPDRDETGGLAALFKPAGVHCESLAGKPGASLASLLPDLLGKARLLNRLDCATSGIVMAALDAEGERVWKEAQDGGQTRKYYLVLLQGRLNGEHLVKERLILKGRERVLVEMAIHPDRRPPYADCAAGSY